MKSIPFAIVQDVKVSPSKFSIPKANLNGIIQTAWLGETPPVGTFILRGFLGSPLPELDSNTIALGYDDKLDQILIWDGLRWRIVA